MDALAERPWPRTPLLLVASSSRTGPAEGQIAAARYLRSQGCDARFAGDTVTEGDIGEHLAHAGVPWLTELRNSRQVKLFDVVHDARLLAGWVRQGKPDLLHAAFAHDHHLCLWAAHRAGPARQRMRTVRTAHRRQDLAPGRFQHRLRALRATDGIVVHCESYRSELLRQGLDPARILCLPGSVDAARFTPGRADHLRAQWGVPLHAPLAGLVSRMKPERNHRQLLQGFASSNTKGYLALIGRGEDEAPLRQLAAALPETIRARIVFGGYLRGEGLVDAYRALDVAVWLKEGNDGACRGVLEAMACGRPVIAGQGCAAAELARDGREGRTVDPDSPQQIGDALAQLLGAPDLAATLGRAARARAEEHTAERFGRTLLAYYRHLRALPPVDWRGRARPAPMVGAQAR